MEQEIEDLTAAIDRQQRAEAREAALNQPINTPLTGRPAKQMEEKTGRASNAYKEDFGAHLCGKRLVHNVLSEGVQADGGYLVSEEFERQIVTGLDEANVVRGLAKVITTSAERKIPVAATHSMKSYLRVDFEDDDALIECFITAAKKQCMDILRTDDEADLDACANAKATLDPDTNEVTFATPVAIPGAVNLSLDPEGDTEPFYAADMVYYTMVANNGYSGDLEIALIPESFRKDILKETEDTNGVLIEDSTVEPEHFALLFEFSGDKKKIRHCMYYCTAARPTIEGKTNEDSKEVQTESLEITATPLPSGLVKVKTGANTDDTVYNGRYQSVYQTPTTEPTEQGQG